MDGKSEVSYAPSTSYRYVVNPHHHYAPSYRVVSPPPSQARSVVGVPIAAHYPPSPYARAVSVPPPRGTGVYVARPIPRGPESVVSYATTTMSAKKYKKREKQEKKQAKEALKMRMKMQQQQQQRQATRRAGGGGVMVPISAPPTPQQLHPRMALRQAQTIGGARPGAHARVLDPHGYAHSVAGDGHVYAAMRYHYAGRNVVGGDFYGDYTVRKEQEIAAWVNDLDIDDPQRVHGTASKMKISPGHPEPRPPPPRMRKHPSVPEPRLVPMAGTRGAYGYTQVLY